MLPYQAALAALRDGRYYAKKAERPLALKTDSGVSLEIPGPAVLADVFALPWLRSGADAYRSSSALLRRPKGSEDEPRPVPLADVAEELLAALEALPELTPAEAGRPYRDLYRYVREASPAARSKYLADVVAQTRTRLSAYRPPKEHEERGPALSPAQRKAAQRERDRAHEEASARDWLEGFLTGWDGDEEIPLPGSRWLASALYGMAAEAIGYTVEDAEEAAEEAKEAARQGKPGPEPETLPDGTPYRVPRQRVFYAVADEILGARRRGAKGSAMVYVIPGA